MSYVNDPRVIASEPGFVSINSTLSDAALLVLDALGGGPHADRLFDADAEHLLASVPLPTLVFGPHATLDTSRSVLLIAADHGPASAASLAVAQAWISTFAAHAVVVGLDSPDSWPATQPAPRSTSHVSLPPRSPPPASPVSCSAAAPWIPPTPCSRQPLMSPAAC
ncbi:MAG: hypothetical protein ABW122_05810 [Ilumatobacteraceae bacterium]